MKKTHLLLLGIVAALALNSGCLTIRGKLADDNEATSAFDAKSYDAAFTAGKAESKPAPIAPKPLELDLTRRMANITEKPVEKEPERLYKFKAKNMNINTALTIFAKSNNLNIVADPDVEGVLTIDFKNLTFEQAMSAILEPNGYYWVKDGSLIRALKYETKMFTIDYLRLIRESQGSSQASIASAGGDSGQVSINNSDTVQFWADLSEQLKELISEEGHITINRMSGIVHVTDLHRNVSHVENFINSITKNVLRQVEIEARIMEVSLNDEFNLGVDWSQVIDALSVDGVGVNSSAIINAPFGAAGAGAPSLSLQYGLFGGDISAVLEALSQQGELKVVSNPRLRVMNNQPALIKVGTDRPFFQTATTVDEGVSQTTEEVRFITEGLVLSITPQISEDGWIMIDVVPIITRLVQTIQSSFGSTAPMMEVKQSSTVVRLRDGEMVTVGGLIQNVEAKTVRKVPLLGDIPYLGNAFKGVSTTKNKTELVIFITPRTIKEL